MQSTESLTLSDKTNKLFPLLHSLLHSTRRRREPRLDSEEISSSAAEQSQEL